MTSVSDPKLVVGGPLGGADNVRTRVKQDIAFFSERIATMERQPRPNRPVIETYRIMLESRKSVLHWLEHGCQDEPTEYTGTGG